MHYPYRNRDGAENEEVLTMDKLNGLMNFLESLECVDVAYGLSYEKDRIRVHLEGMDVLFTGDGEILVMKRDEAGVSFEADPACLEMFLQVKAS